MGVVGDISLSPEEYVGEYSRRRDSGCCRGCEPEATGEGDAESECGERWREFEPEAVGEARGELENEDEDENGGEGEGVGDSGGHNGADEDDPHASA